MRIFERTERLRGHVWATYVVAAALCVASLLLRFAFDDFLVGFPFLTFYPAVLLAALLGGRGPGLFAALISWSLAWYFFVQPYDTFAFSTAGDLVATGLYAFVTGSIVLLIHGMNQAYSERMSVQRVNERIRNLFQRAPGFIAMSTGPDHRLDLTNDSFNDLCGRGSLAGKTIREAVPELEGQGVFEVLDEVYSTGQPFVGQEVRISLKNSAGDLQTRHINFVCTPVQAEDGAVSGIFVEGFDATEARQSRKEIQRLQNDLIHISRLSAMGTMASTLAHELNQPLTAALSYLTGTRRVLEKHGDLPLAAQEGLAGAEEATQRAGAIIRSLRQMSKKTGDENVSAVAQLVNEAKKIALIGASQASVSYSQSVPSDLKVRCDALQLQQVFVNLIRNAVEATSSSATRAVNVAAARMGDLVEVRVSDSGPGIEPGIKPHLFEAFRSTKPEGVGIGLSICRTIIEAHNGRIWAETTDAETSFCFSLPIADEAPD